MVAQRSISQGEDNANRGRAGAPGARALWRTGGPPIPSFLEDSNVHDYLSPTFRLGSPRSLPSLPRKGPMGQHAAPRPSPGPEDPSWAWAWSAGAQGGQQRQVAVRWEWWQSLSPGPRGKAWKIVRSDIPLQNKLQKGPPRMAISSIAHLTRRGWAVAIGRPGSC